MENIGNTIYERISTALTEIKCQPTVIKENPPYTITSRMRELTQSESIAYEQALDTIYERTNINVEDIITR